MARSLGLTAYRAIARRGDPEITSPVAARPNGELVWCHAAEPMSFLAIQDLALRLCSARLGLNVLITVADGDRPKPTIDPITITSLAHSGTILVDAAPDEHPASVAAFLDHWQPDCCLWAWGGLRPNLILETAARNCPLYMVDAEANGFDSRRDRWLPDLTRDLLGLFSAILARSQPGFERLAHLGVPRADMEVTSALQPGGQALPCADSDLAELSTALVGRPTWFANQIQPEELPTVLTAHRQALRLSHRLLLVINPADGLDPEQCVTQAAERDFRVVSWGDGLFPDDLTQIMIAEEPEDRGLFYRVAPVSFLGSSLSAGGVGCDPFEAAALGSAVLYGPKVRRFLPSYTRLAAEGAARIVNDATALGTAVTRLVAPDQAATMAHAGWDVISRGAALTDRVVDLVQDALDRRAKKA